MEKEFNMKVAIDISPLENGHKYRGVGVYTEHLVNALKKHQSGNVYEYFSAKQSIPKDAELVHYPYFDPFFLTLPVLRPVPTVVTVHDLIPLVFPSHFRTGLKGNIRWQIQKFSLRTVRRIITDSDASKKDIVRIIAYPHKRIDRIYLAPTVGNTVTDKNILMRRYKLPDRFLLYLGDVNWNKNVTGLINAFSMVVGSHDYSGINLVLAGKAFNNPKLPEIVQINRMITDLNLGGKIFMPGYIEPIDVAGIYKAAAALVIPSFAEGFGLPVLDALQTGCPVIASNVSSLPEIVGPSITVNPDSAESLTVAIRRLLGMSRQDIEILVQSGKAWVRQFTWYLVAKQTAESYEKAVR